MSFFVSPSAAQNAWIHGRRFVAIDMAHTTTSYKYLIVLAAGYNANDKLNIYAWGLALKESAETWSAFLRRLLICLPGLNHEDTVVISDRQKVSQSCC